MRVTVLVLAIAVAAILLPVVASHEAADGTVVSLDGTVAGFQCSEGLGFEVVSADGDTISFTVMPQKGYSFLTSSISVTVDGEPLEDVAGVYTASAGEGSSIVIAGAPVTGGVPSEGPYGFPGGWGSWYLVPMAAVLLAAAFSLLILERREVVRHRRRPVPENRMRLISRV